MPAKRALKFACIATLAFAGVEFIGGQLVHSLALIADSAHLLADAGALGLAFFASWIASQPATRKMSYGFHRFEILAALVNGVSLVTVSIFITKAAMTRFRTPVPVVTLPMIALALAGLVFNLFVALSLRRSAKESVNIRSAFYHVIADLLGSVGVLAAGLVIWKTGWFYADPLASIGIALLVIWGAWQILKNVAEVLLEATPSRVNMAKLEARLLALAGVEEICDLHVWTISSGKETLSAHLGIQSGANSDLLLKEVNAILASEFNIHHTTIQFEKATHKPHRPHGAHSF